jgi:cytochrome b involved in lipid metabolism
MPTHPGGQDLLENEVGTNIETKFEEAEHTKSAKNIFKSLPVIGKMSREDSDSTEDNKSEDDSKTVN